MNFFLVYLSVHIWTLSSVECSGVINKPTAAIQPNFPSGAGSSQLRSWETSMIPFKLTGTLSTFELALISTAMRQIEIDSGNCIKFQQKSNNDNTGPFIDIRARRNVATPEQICLTTHGYSKNTAERNGQPLVAYEALNNLGGTNSIGACLDNQRDIMRLLMNTLGLRNEWQTAKRSNFMTFAPARNSLVAPEIQSFNLFDDMRITRDDETVDIGTLPFDSQSITMVSPTRYAADPHKPIFTLANNLPPVPDAPRLSLSDCQTLRAAGMYTCLTGFTDCLDAFDLSGPRFFPSNRLTRSLQCQNNLVTQVIGELMLMDVPYTAATPANAAITIESVGTVMTTFGIKATLMRRSDATTAAEAAPVPCPANTLTCYFSVRFELAKVITMEGQRPGGVTNLPVSFNIRRGGVTFITLTAFITVNCAPIFRTISANVGPSNLLQSEVTFRFPDEIVPLEPPTRRDNTALQANSPLLMGQYMVNYHMPVAFGDTGAKANAGGPTTTTVRKVFINCQADTTSIAGHTVVGRVMATDLEGHPVSYYALSSDPRSGAALNAPFAPTAELHTVTPDGVISISGFFDPAETTGGDGAADLAHAGNVLANVDFSGTLPRDVFIVAVDSYGASSILQARFFLACGFPVTA